MIIWRSKGEDIIRLKKIPLSTIVFYLLNIDINQLSTSKLRPSTFLSLHKQPFKLNILDCAAYINLKYERVESHLQRKLEKLHLITIKMILIRWLKCFQNCYEINFDQKVKNSIVKIS